MIKQDLQGTSGIRFYNKLIYSFSDTYCNPTSVISITVSNYRYLFRYHVSPDQSIPTSFYYLMFCDSESIVRTLKNVLFQFMQIFTNEYIETADSDQSRNSYTAYKNTEKGEGSLDTPEEGSGASDTAYKIQRRIARHTRGRNRCLRHSLQKYREGSLDTPEEGSGASDTAYKIQRRITRHTRGRNRCLTHSLQNTEKEEGSLDTPEVGTGASDTAYKITEKDH
jgi:hypothetical protein